jgi:transcriptional regulator
MYLPAHFEETRPELMQQLIAAHPLGTLITFGAGGLNANHIPFLLDSRVGELGTLIGHVARTNDVWQNHDPAVEALVVFQGEAAYISPNWYATKQQTHEVVPTYNYAVVHVYGPLVIHDDPKWLRGVVGRLTKRFEASQPAPWSMGEAPPAFIADMLTKIVGIEIPVRRMVGKWKASQNRPLGDRVGAIAGLRATGVPEANQMAGLMQALLSNSSVAGAAARPPRTGRR